MQIVPGDDKIPTLRPSKSYAFDFKGKIAEKIFLRFRQLSGPVERFSHLAAPGGVLDKRQKVPSLEPYHASRADAIRPQARGPARTIQAGLQPQRCWLRKIRPKGKIIAHVRCAIISLLKTYSRRHDRRGFCHHRLLGETEKHLSIGMNSFRAQITFFDPMAQYVIYD